MVKAKINIESTLGIITAKADIIRRKDILNANNQCNWNNETFREQVLWAIKMKSNIHQKGGTNNTINGILGQKK